MRLRIAGTGRLLTWSAADLPFGPDGQPGSVLDVLLGHGILLEHACGGACACTTCHVIVLEGEGELSPMQDDEEDRLDLAEGLTLRSRLACQCVVVGEGEVTVEIPRHHRNSNAIEGAWTGGAGSTATR